MKEHSEENNIQQNFELQTKEKLCRYFRSGFCSKGEICAFKHIQPHNNNIPDCCRGQDCRFLRQNRCKFFHEQIRAQSKRRKPCKFREECWNIVTCKFSHENQGFRFVQRPNRPPQNTIDLNTWINNY